MDFICSYCGYECHISPVQGYEDDCISYCPKCGEEQIKDLEFDD